MVITMFKEQVGSMYKICVSYGIEARCWGGNKEFIKKKAMELLENIELYKFIVISRMK